MDTINEEKKWKILSSEYLVQRPWLTARRDVAELPDGRVNNEYYVLEYPDWVNIIAITKDGKMVMERQYRHVLGKTCYELPCGVIEAGETPLEAAKRELLEETGFAGGEWQEWMTLSPNPATCTNLAHSFLVTGVERSPASTWTPPRTSTCTSWRRTMSGIWCRTTRSSRPSWPLRCGNTSTTTTDLN